jgi:single-strand DNA-binding protein
MSADNSVNLRGNLTRDPELKQLPNGTAVCEVGLAQNKKYGGKETVHFFELVIFGKGAEIFNQYMTKGKGVLIQGELEYQSWQDTNGNNRSKVKIKVDDFKFLDKPDSKPKQEQSKPGQSKPEPQEQNDYPQGDSEDIPF